MRRGISVDGYGGFVEKKREGRRERKKLGGNYAQLRVNSIE